MPQMLEIISQVKSRLLFEMNNERQKNKSEGVRPSNTTTLQSYLRSIIYRYMFYIENFREFSAESRSKFTINFKLKFATVLG